MAEYINKAELVGNLDRFAPEQLTPLIRTLIEKQPTADVVEVVRCKECIFRYTSTCNAKHERADMDYCSHGERRDA